MSDESDVGGRQEVPLWVGLVDVRPVGDGGVLDGAGGAFAYCAGHAPDLAAFLSMLVESATGSQLELRGIDWLVHEVDLDDDQRAGEAVRDVLAAVDEGVVAWDHFHVYPAHDEVEDPPDLPRRDTMRSQVENFVEGWIDDAVQHHGDTFDLGVFAFVAEMVFDPESPLTQGETAVGFACSDGREAVQADLFRQAAALAADAGK